MVVEADHANEKVQTATPTPSKSTASPAGAKTSFFVKKTGFVIPKNKLSGSLVPVIRGSKGPDGKLLNDEAVNALQGKTKWGPDLTLDSSVRKGRAAAYQTRITQISEQLASGTLEAEDKKSFSATESEYGKKSELHHSNEEAELLMLERRELIGELIKLNPAYKAPADYKPVMKEAKVPIPLKEHHGYNFVDSVFGPASDTLKKIEKDTGAKIKVYGIKPDTGVKVEISSLDGKEIRDVFEEYYAHVSADSFDKVDAAAALVELLATTLSVNPILPAKSIVLASDDDVKNISSSTATAPLVGQEPAKLSKGSLEPPQDQSPFYHQAWPPVGLNQGAPHLQSGLLVPNANSTVPQGGANIETSLVHLNSSNMPPVPPSFVSGSSSVAIHRPQLPHGLQSPYMQQEPGLRNSQASHRLPAPIFSTPTQASPQVASNTVLPMPMIRPRPPHVPVESSVASGLSAMSCNPNNLFPMPQGGSLPLPPLVASEAAPSTSLPPPAGPPVHMLMPASSRDVITPAPAPAPIPFKAFTSRPLQPGTDFLLPHHRPPAMPPLPQVWQGRQPQNLIQPGQATFQPPPQSLFVRRPMPYDLGHPMQKMSNQADHLRPHTPAFFAGTGRPPPSQLPPRHAGSPTLQHHRPFLPHNPVNNAPFPPSPRSQMHHLAGVNPMQRFPMPMAHKPPMHPGRPLPGTMGTPQVYDPFSPSTGSLNPQMGSRAAAAAAVQGDGDPEYEDLMASVGVK